MASANAVIDQPPLPAGMFPNRQGKPADTSKILKGGFFAWYSSAITTTYDDNKARRLIEHSLNHPAIKLLIRAMESCGCHFDPKRHIAVEPCVTSNVIGAYDPKHNQVVVCSNICKQEGEAVAMLGYNMLQMFDACRAHVDFRNIDHVACMEVRSNNLFVCGTLREGRRRGEAPLLNYEGKQSECVRKYAIMSVQHMMNVDEDAARAAVDRVFSRCYGDLEPFGQRFENAKTAEILYERRRNYGYY